MIYRFAILLALAGMMTVSTVCAQPLRTYHTERFDSLDPAAGGPGRYSGLTGYAAPDGREYALLGGHLGTYIVDITEKPIRLVSLVEGPPSDWREIKTYRNYAYVVNENDGGLQIIDLSPLPAPPTVVTRDSSVLRTGHTVSAEGDYLYVHGSNLGAGANSGTLIFNVAANPMAPELVGTFSGHYVHDAYIRNDTMYAAAIFDGKLSIIYLGPDRKNPTLVGEITYPGAGTHNAAITEDGSYLLTTDEVGMTDKTLKFWDIHNLDAIFKVADFTPEATAIVHNVFVKGHTAYVSWYTGGTRIIDISDPLQPVEVGFFDAYPGTGAQYAGNWDVYPYLPSGKIISSYMERGLEVFTFDGARPGRVHGMVVSSITKEPLPGVQIRMAQNNTVLITDNEGRFSFAGAEGTVDFLAYLQNYHLENGMLELKGEGNEVVIEMRNLPLALYSLPVVDDETGEPVETFLYRVYGRENGEGSGAGATWSLALPADSSYMVQIGAWGYQSRILELSMAAEQSLPIRLKRGYADDAELDLGWTLGVAGDRASIGRWERGVPVEVTLYSGNDEVAVQPGADHTHDPGDRAFITGISVPGEYSRPVFGGATTLLSPAFDISSYSDPYINCYLWFSNDAWYSRNFPIIPSDTLEVHISNDDGASWTLLAQIGESTRGWKHFSFRVRNGLSLSGHMRVKFVASDSIAPSVVEAGMDDFSITEGPVLAVARSTGQAARAMLHLAPNPVGGAARLMIVLPASQRNARLELYTMLGERVLLLHEGAMAAGENVVAVETAPLPEGRYMWRLLLDDGSLAIGPMVVIR